MKDLCLKLTTLEKSNVIKEKQQPKREFIKRCIWCDSFEHTSKVCESFQEARAKNLVQWIDGKICSTDTGKLVPTNFGKEGMRRYFEASSSQIFYETSSFLFKLARGQDDEIENLWDNVLTSLSKAKLPIQS
ncbi:hypothetical protein KP509_08G051700 [Ceratopteris richardii]|uniref:Uncharacterized protein n=1 Tax=Ceratopteris richardii TaxID=49495 RepID=A0A8T2U6Q4_CERRI|nr:hypothetical protein KP509_08G051700 [Ceratopteris richardii]